MATHIQFVAEGDLLLTVGYAIKDDPAAPTEAVRQLAARSAAGVIIKPEPYLGEVPSGMRQLADELAIPIVWLPENVDAAAVTLCTGSGCRQRTKAEFDEVAAGGAVGDRQPRVTRSAALAALPLLPVRSVRPICERSPSSC